MSNLTYYGIATLSVGDKEGLFKNTGTKELGLIITKALAGYSIADEVPKFFNIQMNEGTDLKPIWTNLLTRELPFTGITYSNDVDDECIGKLDLNCIVLASDKLILSVTENATLRLIMLNNKGNILAEVIDNELPVLFNDITEGTDCIVKWNMSFHSKEQESQMRSNV